MIYQNLVSSGGTSMSYGTVTVGAPLATFYGGTATTLDAYFAPSYGRAAHAEMLRDQFNEDLQHATAVFCLGRNVVNAIRPTTIPLSGTLLGSSVNTPEAFRLLLATNIPASATTFTSYSGASTATNASIFMLSPSTNATSLTVLAVYDIDLTATASPAGTYASVKRYEAGTITDYYDVFYPSPSSAGIYAFNPLVVFFPRASGNSTNPLGQAAERPFYFVWWPDPASPTLEATSAAATGGAGDPRSAYAAMGGRTSFFFVVPMFPAL
jgi:hypothetical protein